MRTVSLKTQKLLMFIPIINFFIPIIWVCNCKMESRMMGTRSRIYFILGFFYGFVCGFLAFVGYSLLCKWIPEMSTIFLYAVGYLAPLSTDIGLILLQKKMGIL